MALNLLTGEMGGMEEMDQGPSKASPSWFLVGMDMDRYTDKITLTQGPPGDLSVLVGAEWAKWEGRH